MPSYGLESTVKEASMTDQHRKLDVNFFGSDATTKAVQSCAHISTLDADNSPVHLVLEQTRCA